jgi:hypothetical protein
MYNSTDLAYTAGYIDGDGCFHLRKQVFKGNKRPKYSAKLIISSVNPDVLHWFKKTFGGVVREVKRKSLPDGHKRQYHFIFDNKSFKDFSTELTNIYLVEKRVESAWFSNFLCCKFIEDKESCIDELQKEKHKFGLVLPSQKIEFEDRRNTIKFTELDLAYLAGFIDAECCLGIQRYKPKKRPNHTYKIQLQCNNTKYPFFKWALERFGGQIHFIERQKSMGQRDQLCWRLSAKALLPILKGIQPYIKHKLPVCEELIKFYKTTVPLKNTISRNSPHFAEYYRPILEERESIFHKIQILNKKGI